MKESDKTNYLGNIFTSRGGVRDTLEDRRNKGWGKVSMILGMLNEMDMGGHRMEIGLLIRKTILVNSLLFTSETWLDVKEADIVRLEQVDEALLRSLVKGHSKCPTKFQYLEMGILKLRHILTINHLMFHHYLKLKLSEKSM